MGLSKQEMMQKVLEYYRLYRNTDAAEFFGVTPQTMFARMKSGKLDYEEIYEKCPDISPDWLLSGGEGEMLRKDRGEKPHEARSAGGAVVADNSEALEKAMSALAAEQQAMRRAQDQISALIELLRGKQG